MCDLQGYVDLISLARYFASRRSDPGLFLFIFVGKFLFSMLRNPSIRTIYMSWVVLFLYYFYSIAWLILYIT
jgi:hypothetical protein